MSLCLRSRRSCISISFSIFTGRAFRDFEKEFDEEGDASDSEAAAFVYFFLLGNCDFGTRLRNALVFLLRLNLMRMSPVAAPIAGALLGFFFAAAPFCCALAVASGN